MNENIKRLSVMLENSQKNQDDIKTKHNQSLNSKDKEIDDLKNIIEDHQRLTK